MRLRALATFCLLALLVSACGSDGASTGSDADPDSPQTTAAPSDQEEPADEDETGGADQSEADDNSDASQGLPPGGTGTVTIDGETIEPAWVGNCQIDEQFDPQPGDLDVNVSLDGGLEALFLEISMSEVMGVPAEDSYTYTSFRPELQLRSESGSFVSYEPTSRFVTGPDGTWYSDEVGNVPMALAVGVEHEGVVLDEPPVVVDGDNITGAATLESDERSIEVIFDLNLADPVDCSLD